MTSPNTRRSVLVGLSTLLLCVSSTALAQWEPERQLSASSAPFGALTADGDSLHAVWVTGWGGSDLRYARSTDQGTTWSTERTIAQGGIHFTQPLHAEGGNVYLVYVSDLSTFPVPWGNEEVGNLYFLRSRDDGVTWDPPVQLTTNGTVFRYAVSTAGSRIDLVWNDWRLGTFAASEIFYRRSADAGGSWDPEQVLVSHSQGVGAVRPHVASHGDSIHVVWEDERDGRPQCFSLPSCPNDYYKHSNDGGKTWSADSRIGSFSGNAYGRPEIAVVPDTGAVIYASQDILVPYNGINEAMFVRVSKDDGQTFGPARQLTFTNGNADHPQVSAVGSRFFLVWMDDRANPSTTGSDEAYFLMTEDDGATWIPEEKVSNQLGSFANGVAATSAYAHVIWQQSDSNGTAHLFYRRRALGATVVPPSPTDAGVDDAGSPPVQPAEDGGSQPGHSSTDGGSVAPSDAGSDPVSADGGTSSSGDHQPATQPSGHGALTDGGLHDGDPTHQGHSALEVSGTGCTVGAGSTVPVFFVLVGAWLARRRRGYSVTSVSSTNAASGSTGSPTR